jgi:hypothetical protein
VLPIAATQPPGEPTRLDAFRGPLAAELLSRLTLADADVALAEALDRWELSLFQHDPFRAEQLRGTLRALLYDTWPLRAAVLLERDPAERERVHGELVALADGETASASTSDVARRTLVEILRHGDRVALVHELDRSLLGAGA